MRDLRLFLAVAALALLPAGPAAETEKPSAASIDLMERHDVRFMGADAEDELGVQVRFGDLDGDGYDEIILGAWLADGRHNNRARSGEVAVYFGGPREKEGKGSWNASVIYGAESNDRIGSSADVGDWDGDGIPDLLIGARYADGPSDSLRPRSGQAFLLLGGSDGKKREVLDVRKTPDLLILGCEEGDRLGRRILVADLDHDGKEDLLLAAVGASGPRGETRDAGAVYVLYGDLRDEIVGILDLSVMNLPVLYGGDDADALGSAMAAGDWNGDGEIDLFLGCGFADGPANGRTNAGEVYVLFGAPGTRFAGERVLSDGSEYTIYGAEAYDAAGIAVSAGDLDGDRVDDLVIGANLADGPNNERENCGEVYVLFGSRSAGPGTMLDLALGRDLTIYGAERGDQVGSVLHCLDWNEDGYGDLVTSSLLNDGPGGSRVDAGMLYVFLGRPQSDLRPIVDLLEPEAADLRMLGPSAGDKIATLLESSRLSDRVCLLAGTMLGDGPNDERRDAGEIYILRWKPGDGK
ncbi:MAG: VCBS repeat-containing protein [Candidatus Eisenbacteria bacterium]|nr:VCBS repeat-containing protein [Candidatus Eisenbacteria bacterium]